MTLRIYQFLQTIINIGLSLMTFFLLLRVLLRFFAANTATPFVSWILDISSFLMAPFANIVPNIITQTGVLDIVALITLVTYLIAGFILLSMIQSMIGGELIEEEEYPTIAHYHRVTSRKKV